MNIGKEYNYNKDSFFKSLVVRYWARLHKYAEVYVRDSMIAEELVEDTFLIFWNKIEDLKEDTNIISYLTIVLKNKCLNHLKSLSSKGSSYENYSVEEIYNKINIDFLENDASSLLEVEDLQKVIDDIIDALPPKTKQVFVMSRYEGLKNREIAERLQISEKTVEFHISKSLLLLKEKLPNEYYLLFVFLFITINK